MHITVHAQKRMQQRAIPPFIVDLLHACGSSKRCGGAEKIIFDKAARKRLKNYLGGERGFKIIEPWLRSYVVLGDNGNIVTAAHSICRNKSH